MSFLMLLICVIFGALSMLLLCIAWFSGDLLHFITWSFYFLTFAILFHGVMEARRLDANMEHL